MIKYLIVFLLIYQPDLLQAVGNSRSDNVQVLNHFDNTEGTFATDSAQKKSTGMIMNNGATFINGKFGRAASFDGANDYAIVPTDNNIFDFPNPSSLAFWIRRHENVAQGQDDIMGIGTAANEWLLYVVSGQNDLAFYNDPNNTVIGAPLFVNFWHSIVMTYDGTYFKIYKDSFLVKTITTLTTASTANRFRMGANASGTNPTTIDIDDLTIWDRALTVPEVRRFHAQGFPVHISD